MNVEPINDFIICKKCFVDHVRHDDGSVLLYRTEQAQQDSTQLAEIVDVSKDCRYIRKEHIGKFILLPIWSVDMHGVEDDIWFVRERLYIDGPNKALGYLIER